MKVWEWLGLIMTVLMSAWTIYGVVLVVFVIRALTALRDEKEMKDEDYTGSMDHQI
jgi:hypothetical protein